MEDYNYRAEDFSLDAEDLLLKETLFHNANGYIGVRSNFEEGYPNGYPSIRGTYINGFYNNIAMPQAEKLCGFVDEKQTMLNVVDSQGITLLVDGEQFQLFEGTVHKKDRILDMKAGVTIREIIWESPNGKKIVLKITRMTSYCILPLFLIRYEVKALNFTGRIELKSSHEGEVGNYFDASDPRVAAEPAKHLLPVQKRLVDGTSYVVNKTSNSGLFVCSAVRNLLDKECSTKIEETKKGYREHISCNISCNETIRLYKYTIIVDSLRYENYMEKAAELMKLAVQQGADRLYQKQEKYLAEFWENTAFMVDGDARLNQAVHFNMYQLLQSVTKDSIGNIAAKGLSGEGYEGHYFWDTEMYIQPFFILNAPDIAKKLIRFRYRTLNDAKENAKIMGHTKGALYPWRTIMGKECSGYFPSGSAAYHINGDIAYAIISYYFATKDIQLLAECGAEILIETARLWLEAGNYVEDRFMINGVTGPDEYTCLVNNNYYTNTVAQYNLRWASKAVSILKDLKLDSLVLEKTQVTKEELQAFVKAADAMYLPYDEKMGINPQDDSFLQKKVWEVCGIPEEKKPLLLHYHPMYLYRHQICKQADTVLSHVILEDAADEAIMRRSFYYYERITTHDSSLSCCIFSIAASRLGMYQKAYEYFGESSKLDLYNTHKNTKDGIHTANMGGSYMAIVYGFAGVRVRENGIYFAPFLPEAWNAYQFRIIYEGSTIELKVEKNKCRFTLVFGKAKELYVYGKQYRLIDRLEIGE